MRSESGSHPPAMAWICACDISPSRTFFKVSLIWRISSKESPMISSKLFSILAYKKNSCNSQGYKLLTFTPRLLQVLLWIEIQWLFLLFVYFGMPAFAYPEFLITWSLFPSMSPSPKTHCLRLWVFIHA